MTPEERAASIKCLTHAPHDHTVCIATAIREAVAEERERCAKIAETIDPEGNYFYNDDRGSYWESDWRKTVAEVARLIREGNNP